jgi:hypothetical protein
MIETILWCSYWVLSTIIAIVVMKAMQKISFEEHVDNTERTLIATMGLILMLAGPITLAIAAMLIVLFSAGFVFGILMKKLGVF